MNQGAANVSVSTPGLYTLPEIPWLRLHFELRALEPARLPPYKGSTLRGAFGHALRRTVCAMGPAQSCETCRLRPACIYPKLLETSIEGTPPPFLRGIRSAPRPYVFEPGDQQREFAPGDPLAFDLLLIGQAAGLVSYALLAVERMARSGLGTRYARFELVHAEARKPDGSRDLLFKDGHPTPPTTLLPALPARGEIDPSRATLHLLTPLRIKERNHLASTLNFRTLAFNMLRRTLELAWFHAPGAAIDWTFQPLLAQTAHVEMTSHLTWHDWERYSNPQQTHLALGGLVGTVELKGDLAPFLPLLRTAEVLHVGKGTVFGLGRIAVE
jgi:hypothetical protein